MASDEVERELIAAIAGRLGRPVIDVGVRTQAAAAVMRVINEDLSPRVLHGTGTSTAYETVEWMAGAVRTAYLDHDRVFGG